MRARHAPTTSTGETSRLSISDAMPAIVAVPRSFGRIGVSPADGDKPGLHGRRQRAGDALPVRQKLTGLAGQPVEVGGRELEPRRLEHRRQDAARRAVIDAAYRRPPLTFSPW